MKTLYKINETILNIPYHYELMATKKGLKLIRTSENWSFVVCFYPTTKFNKNTDWDKIQKSGKTNFDCLINRFSRNGYNDLNIYYSRLYQ